MMEERLPVSAEWLKRLKAIGAKECFKGKLNSILGQLSHPCWCLQLTDFADKRHEAKRAQHHLRLKTVQTRHSPILRRVEKIQHVHESLELFAMLVCVHLLRV